MESQIFEPMSVGRILDNTFRIYKNNFIRFITIVAIIQIPISLLISYLIINSPKLVIQRSEQLNKFANR